MGKLIIVGILISIPVIIFSVAYYVIKETVKEINLKFDNDKDENDNLSVW